MDFKGYSILNKTTFKDEEKRLNIELYETNKPLFEGSEFIAVISEPKDKRSYSDMTIVLEPEARALVNLETFTKEIIKEYERGSFLILGDNKALYYGTLQPIASMIKTSAKKGK